MSFCSLNENIKISDRNKELVGFREWRIRIRGPFILEFHSSMVNRRKSTVQEHSREQSECQILCIPIGTTLNFLESDRLFLENLDSWSKNSHMTLLDVGFMEVRAVPVSFRRNPLGFIRFDLDRQVLSCTGKQRFSRLFSTSFTIGS